MLMKYAYANNINVFPYNKNMVHKMSSNFICQKQRSLNPNNFGKSAITAPSVEQYATRSNSPLYMRMQLNIKLHEILFINSSTNTGHKHRHYSKQSDYVHDIPKCAN